MCAYVRVCVHVCVCVGGVGGGVRVGGRGACVCAYMCMCVSVSARARTCVCVCVFACTWTVASTQTSRIYTNRNSHDRTHADITVYPKLAQLINCTLVHTCHAVPL